MTFRQSEHVAADPQPALSEVEGSAMVVDIRDQADTGLQDRPLRVNRHVDCFIGATPVAFAL
jgi:hypothetical protein